MKRAVGAPAAALPTRHLDRAAMDFTEVGFGGAVIGNLAVETMEHDATEALSAAWAGGIRYIDTAPHYGLGLSERRIGAWLAGRGPGRTRPLLSTKVGRLLEPVAGTPAGRDEEGFAVPAAYRRVRDYSADGVRRSLEASLARLGVDRVDIVLVHDPDDFWDAASTQAVPALIRMREEGVVGAVGVGMNQAAMLTRFVRETDIDLVMPAGRFTLLDDTGLRELLPEALRRGIGVLAAGVFNSGLLARDEPPPDAHFDYRPAPAPLMLRARLLASICREHGSTLPAAAMHYVLRHPAVLTTVLGMRTPSEARRNVALYATPPPSSLWEAFRAEGVTAPEDAV